MVFTRNDATNSPVPQAPHTPLDSESPPSPLPAVPNKKVSREMRKLRIDANPALGGSGTLKRKRGKDPEPLIPTPPRSHSIASSGHSPDGADKIRAEAAARSRDSGYGTSSTETELMAGDPQLKARDSVKGNMAYNSHRWFMPEDVTDSNGASDDDTAQSHVQFYSREPSKPLRRERKSEASLRSPPAPKSLPASKLFVKAGEGSPAGQPPVSKKVSRELRKLKVDANPALTLEDVTPGTKRRRSRAVSVAVTPQTHDQAHEGDRRTAITLSPQQHVQKQSPTKRVKREMKKLLIDANPSLGGLTTAKRTPRSSSQYHKHHLARHNAAIPPPYMAFNPRNGRKHKSAGTLRRPPNADARLEPFPADPALVDQVLLLFAEAAGEWDLVRSMQGQAQRALGARIAKRESTAEHLARMRGELAMAERWPLGGDVEGQQVGDAAVGALEGTMIISGER